MDDSQDKYRGTSHFSRMVDELVKFSESDPELADGIRWLDEQGKSSGKTIYEMVFNVLYNHKMNESAAAWLRERSHQPRKVHRLQDRTPGTMVPGFQNYDVYLGGGLVKALYQK